MEIVLTGVLIPCVVAFLTYFVFKLFEERKKHKIDSLLGVEVLTMLIEEVKIGQYLIKNTCKPENNLIPDSLPHLCWNGVNTISNDILLRIFEVSKSKSNEEYPEKNIRLYCKDYYEKIIPEWNSAISKVDTIDATYNFKIRFGERIATVNELILMLTRVRSLLEKNAEKIFPK